MKREAGGPCLSAVFVDYDNIYLSLKRKSEEAAKRFAKDASAWLHEIESGRLITPTNSMFSGNDRRIVMNRCYGNPVPRRNTHDNSTDMNSFPFVRHHFLRAGFEVVDCPPLTAQLKNSSDIRMVMDVRDYLTHDTYFDEFIILSGDADFTPVLHRLRAHARRTVIFANDFTAAPYTAISDGEVRESDLIALILNGQLPASEHGGNLTPGVITPSIAGDNNRREILAEVIAGVRASNTPVPLEALADRAVRALGHEKTIATGWAGAGSFRELLRQSLPGDIRLTDDPPYLAMDTKRHALDTMRPAALLREAAADMAAAAGLTPQQLAGPGQHNDPLAQYGIIPTSQPAVATPRGGAPRAFRDRCCGRGPRSRRSGLDGHPAVDRSHPRGLPGAADVAARVSRAVRGDGQGDQRERSDRRADAGQHYATCAGEGPGGASRRRALRARGGQRGRSVVRAGRLGQPVCRPLPQLRGGALPRPGSQFVRRRVGPDRRMVRRRLAAAGACAAGAVTCQVAFWWHARDR